MDILKKMFQSEFDQQQQQQKEQDASASASASSKDEFRKPQWFEEAETDDELFDDDRKFAFQVFTSPMEMEKHFERQLQRLLESIHENNEDAGVERNLKEDFLKPGFESKILKEFQKKASALDTDLDGEIYPDQLYSLIQRLNPEEGNEHILPSNQRGLRKSLPRFKLSDEELIMGRIHGTLNADGELKPGVMRPSRPPPPPPTGKPSIMTPMTPFGGVFDGTYQGPKMFSQSVMTKTIRKPDGSYETTKVTQDSSGQKTTTVTRIVDGRKETTVSQEDGLASKSLGAAVGEGATGSATGTGADRVANMNRNIFVTKEGYAMPRNLW
ncbi:GH10579 [Drosophila grimshawi]|uniref:GH10579 n=2 Tax=Drosophila grimshawi TaxID=7222 RepID=B4JDB5_DROGR|nr:GH10579 [Drosophila grimshawi]